MTSEQYGELKRLIEERSAEDGERFALTDQRFVKIDQRFEQIDQRFAQIDLRFDQIETSLRAEIRAAAVDTRRHFEVVAESLRPSITLIAQGYDNHTKVLADHEGRLVRLEQARLRFDA